MQERADRLMAAGKAENVYYQSERPWQSDTSVAEVIEAETCLFKV